MYRNYFRASDGDNPYFEQINGEGILPEKGNWMWTYADNLPREKYEPMTEKDIPGYDLKEAIKAMNKIKVNLTIVPPGAIHEFKLYNEGITDCIKILKKALKKTAPPIKSNSDVSHKNNSTP
jgi:hypothetical protein